MCRSTSSMVAIVVVLLRAGTVLLRDDVSSGIDNDASSFGASFVERRRTSDWPPSVRGDPSTFVACFAGLAATEGPAKATSVTGTISTQMPPTARPAARPRAHSSSIFPGPV